MRYTSPNSFSIIAVVLLALSATHSAEAAFVFSIQQVGLNVVTTGSGTINTGGLSAVTQGVSVQAEIISNIAILVGGPAAATTCENASGVSGPKSFGTLSTVLASSGSGNVVGIYGIAGVIYLPSNYVSNTPLAFTDTYNNTTLSGLGITTGTYAYTIGSGGNADSLTVFAGTAVPEPASLSLLVLGLPCLLRRSRRAVGAN